MTNAIQAAALAAALLAATGPARAHHEHQEHHDPHRATVASGQKPWGRAGDARHARTVEITMHDNMRFSPSRVQVKQGETVRFVIRNQGGLLHEMVLGTPEELASHAAMMKQHPDMQHDEASMSHVAAGTRGELVWNFNRAGSFRFACLVPGHFEAGMTGTIVVAPAAHRH